jgi:hypothetical protein
MRIDKTRFLTLAQLMAAPLVTACVVPDAAMETEAGASTASASGEPTTGATGSGESGDPGTSDGSTSGAPLPACVDEDIGSQLGETVASNAGLEEVFLPGCTDESGASYMVQWTAPADASYTFVAQSEAFSPVVAMLEPTCEGAWQDCNVFCTDSSALVQRYVAAGEVLHVMIASYSGDGGPFSLMIEEQAEGVDCESSPPPETDTDGSTGIDTEGDSGGTGTTGE